MSEGSSSTLGVGGSSQHSQHHYHQRFVSAPPTSGHQTEGNSELPPVVRPHPEWKIEPHSDKLQQPVLTKVEEVYIRDFGKSQPHMNFIGTINGEGHCVVSVLKNPENEPPKISQLFGIGPTYKSLLIDGDGYEEFYLHNVPLQRGGTEQLPVFEHFLNHRIIKKDLAVYAATSKTFINDLIDLERKFSRRVKAMKIAVLYIRPGQTDVKNQIFPNQPPENSRFYTFMHQIADEIDMKEWKGYRGDMGTSGDDVAKPSFYCCWNDIQIMFHIAPYMNAEQHRRLVGNDIGVIIFHDTDKPENNLEMFPANDLGIVPHVFAVVEPHPSDIGKYRLGFFTRPAVPPFGPSAPPKDEYLKIKSKPSLHNLKDFLFTKLHNGLYSAQSVSPLNRLYVVPRREALKDLVQKYPRSQKLFEDFPIAGNIAGNIGGALGAAGALGGAFGNTITGVLGGLAGGEEKVIVHNGPRLVVDLLRGKQLASKDSNGFSDPYCRLMIGQKEHKSQVIRKTLQPLWNETYEFDLEDDYELEEFHLVCMDWDKVGGHDFMGENYTYLKDLPTGGKKWFPLFSTTAELVTGEIELSFKLLQSPTASNSVEEKHHSFTDSKEDLSPDSKRIRGATISKQGWTDSGRKKGKKSPRGPEHSRGILGENRKGVTNASTTDTVFTSSGGMAQSKDKSVPSGISLPGMKLKLPRTHSEKDARAMLRKKKTEEDDFLQSSEESSVSSSTKELIKTTSSSPSAGASGGASRPKGKMTISNIEDKSEPGAAVMDKILRTNPDRPVRVATENASIRSPERPGRAPLPPPNTALAPSFTLPKGFEIGSRPPQSPRSPQPRVVKNKPREESSFRQVGEDTVGPLVMTKAESDSTAVGFKALNHSVSSQTDTKKHRNQYAQGRSVSTDVIKRPSISKRSPYSSEEANRILDDVKVSVERLLLVITQEEVIRETALKAATDIRENVDKLTTLIETDYYRGDMKKQALQLIAVARLLLKNCLEYLKVKLTGNDPSHLLPTVKKNREEFRKCVSNVSQLKEAENQFFSMTVSQDYPPTVNDLVFVDYS